MNPLLTLSLLLSPTSRQQQFVGGGTHLGSVRAPQPHQELVSGAPISQFAPVNTVLYLTFTHAYHPLCTSTLPQSVNVHEYASSQP